MPILGHGVCFAEVAQGQHLGMVWEVGHEGADRELSPTGCERDVVFDLEVLLGEHQHGVIEEGTMHRLKLGVAQFGEVQTLDGCADVRGEHGLGERCHSVRSPSVCSHRVRGHRVCGHDVPRLLVDCSWWEVDVAWLEFGVGSVEEKADESIESGGNDEVHRRLLAVVLD